LVLSWFYHPVGLVNEGFKVGITIGGERIIGIAAPCNALEIYVLYLAFLICFPAGNRRRLIFAAIGVPTIYWINVVRCALMAWINIGHRNWFEISHHYVFTTLVYLIVFGLWVLFTRKELSHEV
jgi:exosortase/archaeosortase family protein